MKNILFLFIFCLGTGLQAQQDTNPFARSENTAEGSDPNGKADPQAADGPGNPDGGDDLPIDDYIPFLVITGVGIIIYTTHKKKKLQS